MAGYFTKLDAGITDSTIWLAPDTTRIVWITMMAMADQTGYVGASLPGLASRARVSLPACVEAIKSFLEPDEYSRTTDFDGRRIAEADGGWVLLNHAKYRAKISADDRRERSRLAMAALRARRKAEANNEQKLASVIAGEQSYKKLSQAEADNRGRDRDIEDQEIGPGVIAGASVAKAPAKPRKTGTRLPEEWQLPLAWGQWALKEYPHWTPEVVRKIGQRFRDHWTAKPGKDATKLDWLATWRNWCASGITQKENPLPTGNGSGETAYQRGKRERVSELTGGLAARAAPRQQVIDIEATERKE